MSRLAWIGFLLVLAGPARAYTIDLPALPDPGVTGDALFARIDSLEARHAVASGAERGRLAARLGSLYLATGLSSHEQTAQDYLREATDLDPDEPGPAWWSAIAYQHSGYFTLARKRLGELLASDPDDVEHILMLARLEFVESRLRFHERAVDSSYQLYVRALAWAPDRPEALLGAGSTALLVGNHELARSCAERLREIDPDRIEGWYLRAAAQHRMGNSDQAWLDYVQAISRSPQEERDAFLGGGMLVSDEDLARLARRTVSPERAGQVAGARRRDGGIDWFVVAADPELRSELLDRWWASHDASPAAFENLAELEFWTRLVEADLVFARPDLGLRGWQTLPGEVWMRLGRPLSQHHWVSENGMDVQAQEAPAGRGAAMVFDPPRIVWDWGYVIDGIPVTMRFVDESYGQPAWSVGSGGTVDLGVLRNEMPFVEPARQREADSIELYTRVARFARGEESLLETSISADYPLMSQLAGVTPDSLVLEWTLLDARGEPVDQVVRTLGPEHRLSRLIAASRPGDPRVSRDPFVAVVGARVDAGSWRIRVRAIDPANGNFSSKLLGIGIPVEADGGHLALSSIQLAHGLPGWQRGSTVPPEFVKYGRVVLSAADAIIEGDRLGIFYELENPGVDESGRTRFDVEYSIYEATGKVRLAALLDSFDPAGVEEVDVATVEYLRETTGVSPDGHVVKGTTVDISGLREGDYVLRITIDDLVSGEECAGTVAFRRLAPLSKLATVDE